MKVRDDEGVPAWLIDAIRHQHQKRFSLPDKVVSVTSLLQPSHMTRLQEAHEAALAVNPDDAIPALIGTAWHAYVERYMPDHGLAEQRLLVSFQGWTLTGQPDWFDAVSLIDHKTTRVWSAVFGRPEWEEQLNVYAWMVGQVYGYDIRQLEVHAVYTDWSEAQAMRNPDLPRKRFEVVPVRRWSTIETESFLETRLDDLVSGSGICTPTERWERGESWAVKRIGKKNAIKLHADEDAAKAHAESATGLYVEHRPGDPVRCRRYCNVAEFCTYGRQLHEA